MQTAYTKYDIPEAKDKFQWYAGGILKNESFAGGVNFSPTSMPSFDNKQNKLDLGTFFTIGDFSFLNEGLSIVQTLAQAGVLDVIRDRSVTDVQVITYTTDIINITTGKLISSNSSNEVVSGGYNTQSANVQDTKDMYDNRFDFSTMNLSDPISIVTTISSLTTQKEFSLSQTLGSGLIGTAMNKFSGAISQGVIDTFGITNLTVGVFTTGIISSIFSELAQYALGLDNNIGFGGEIMGTNQYGKNVYGRAKSFSQGLKEMMPDWARDMFGVDYGFEDAMTALENNNSFGLTNDLGETFTYGYDSITGDTTEISGSIDFANSQQFDDMNKEAENLAQDMIDRDVEIASEMSNSGNGNGFNDGSSGDSSFGDMSDGAGAMGGSLV